MNNEPRHYSDEADERSKRASIEYIFCDHSPGNLSKVADALIESNGDIIAIEKVREGSFGMGTAAEKADLSRRMTEFLLPDSNITETAAEFFETDEPLFTKLLDTLKGSGRRVVLMDMGTDDEGYYLYRKAQELRKAYIEKLDEQNVHNDTWRDELNDLALDYQVAAAQENEYRESVMGKQIALLAETNPELKITAMIGALHTPVSYGMNRHHNVSRTFISTDEEAATYAPTEIMRFGSGVGIRTLRLNLKTIGLSVLDEDNNLIVQPSSTSREPERVE